MLRKITRKDLNKNNIVVLGYCQCQAVLDMFADNYKIGYNSGIYGWNYDLYRINGVDIITGYNVPYYQYSNEEIKNKLVAIENEIEKDYRLENKEKLKKEFLKIFQ